MHIVAMAWMFVVVLMALTEATAPQGTLLGAFFTLLLYGVIPLAVVLYLLATPMRRRRRVQAESARADGDRRGHPPGATVAPEREEA